MLITNGGRQCVYVRALGNGLTGRRLVGAGPRRDGLGSGHGSVPVAGRSNEHRPGNVVDRIATDRDRIVDEVTRIFHSPLPSRVPVLWRERFLFAVAGKGCYIAEVTPSLKVMSLTASYERPCSTCH